MAAILRNPKVLAATALGVGALYMTNRYMSEAGGGTGAYKKFPPSADYPDLSTHNNVMATHLSPQVYKLY
jgi:hypothetical protein